MWLVKSMVMKSLLSLLLFFGMGVVTSCSSKSLHVYSQYVCLEDRASSHVDSPDPALFFPCLGQKVIVSWAHLAIAGQTDPWKMRLTLRFRDGSECKREGVLCQEEGTYIFSLLGRAFFSSGGIVTYKVELFAGETLIESWHHQLWKERLNLHRS